MLTARNNDNSDAQTFKQGKCRVCMQIKLHCGLKIKTTLVPNVLHHNKDASEQYLVDVNTIGQFVRHESSDVNNGSNTSVKARHISKTFGTSHVGLSMK